MIQRRKIACGVSRKGLFPSVGAVAAAGTTVIIEDVAFPVDRLADAAVDLIRLFEKHHYDNAIIFGHAKDGNLHFVITQGFNTERKNRAVSRLHGGCGAAGGAAIRWRAEG